nr:fused MFS/spermidine synthase [Zoogloeaceae bacterium]
MSAETAARAAVPPTSLPAAVLFAVVFVEGFSSLGAEIVALRRLVPHVGSAITVTAPTIGFFLLALALGYQAGGRVDGDYLARVRRNFLYAAALISLGLAGPVADALFAHLRPVPLAYLVLVGAVLCPVAWLLGQTVPVLTNLLRHERAGARSGAALYWSTLGSFLGSLSLSVLVMQWLGVAAAVLVCAGLLLLVVPFIRDPAAPRWAGVPASLAIAAGAVAVNVVLPQQVETAYATYRVAAAPVALPGMLDPRVFWVNNSVASLIDGSEPPRYSRYIERLRARLEEMGVRNKRILVLGAGGFTLSHRTTTNDYLYVDIDPAVRELAERDFLGEPIRGDFVAADARQFVAGSSARFDVVVVDAYSALTSIPAHLVTREFWRDTRKLLEPDGVMFANLIVDNRLATPYARNLLASIEAEYGRCGVEILFHDRPQSNVLVQCFAGPPPQAGVPYTDEINRADVDILRSQ